ncbi:MAG: hypothetical protein FWC43_12200 [Planctomycetaceae bacterium]|nr:hypothetical protein [Planctomycetaceae bacterium]
MRLTRFFDFQKFVSENLQTSFILHATKTTNFSDEEATRELFRHIADGLVAAAKLTPNKMDDQLAAIFQYGVNSNLCWKAFWKIVHLIPNPTPEAVTTELCKEFVVVADDCAASPSDSYAGVGMFNLFTMIQFVRLAIQVYNFIKGLNHA